MVASRGLVELGECHLDHKHKKSTRIDPKPGMPHRPSRAASAPPARLLLLLCFLLSRPTAVTSICRVTWQVGCGQKTVTSNVTFYLLDDTPGADVASRYDADVTFHWGQGQASTDLGTRAYATGETIEILSKPYEYATDGEYYAGYAVTFGEGSGRGCEGRTFEGYARVTFDDAARTCGFGPQLQAPPDVDVSPFVVTYSYRDFCVLS